MIVFVDDFVQQTMWSTSTLFQGFLAALVLVLCSRRLTKVYKWQSCIYLTYHHCQLATLSQREWRPNTPKLEPSWKIPYFFQFASVPRPPALVLHVEVKTDYVLCMYACSCCFYLYHIGVCSKVCIFSSYSYVACNMKAAESFNAVRCLTILL